MSEKDLKELADILKVISDPNRLKILACLCPCSSCVCEIEKCLGLPQNLVSHHLKILRDIGLVSFSRKGKWKHYSINEKSVKHLEALLGEVLINKCNCHVSNIS